jgi:hypothetical protein
MGGRGSGPKPLGARPMTGAERQRRYYAKITAPKREAKRAFWDDWLRSLGLDGGKGSGPGGSSASDVPRQGADSQ